MNSNGLFFDEPASQVLGAHKAPDFAMGSQVEAWVASCVQAEFGAWFSQSQVSPWLVQSILARLK